MQVRFLPGSPFKFMNDKQKQTIRIYDDLAEKFAVKFDKTGVRSDDIDRLFEMLAKEDPFVFEIGCGAGRDAAYF